MSDQARIETVTAAYTSQARRRSTSAYGVFAVVHDRSLANYHLIGTRDLLKRLA